MTRRASFAVVAVSLVAATAAIAASGTGPLGPLGASSKTGVKTYKAFYDGHKDVYAITDVSNKAQATAIHANYSAAIGHFKGAPLQYFFKGKAAPGQISVLGSEPGESDYNPLWEEVWVTWKPGVTPTLMTSDNAINAMASKHKLTIKDAHIVDNAPVLKVG
jgi:hypothetical protein